MPESKITNEMLYELLRQQGEIIRDFKSDVNRRFGEMDRKFEDMDRRFEDVNRQLGEIRTEVHADREKLQEVYDSRQEVTVTFSRAFAGITAVVNALIAATVAFFVGN